MHRQATPSIALIGCGHWGRHILRDLRSLGAVVTVVARSEESRERARAGGAHAIVGSIAELPRIDGAVVATLTVAHAAAIAELLPLRVPVFCEKPLAPSLADSEHIARLAGERVFVMDKWRYHPGIEMLRDIARDGELGRVAGLSTVRQQQGTSHSDVDAIWVLLPHDLAIAVEILGHVPAARAAVAEPGGAGMVALLGDDPWHSTDVSCAAPGFRREIRLICEHGSAWLAGGYAESIVVARPGRDLEQRALPADLPLLRELRAFLEHVAGGPPPRSSAADAVEIVRRVEQLRALAMDRDDSL